MLLGLIAIFYGLIEYFEFMIKNIRNGGPSLNRTYFSVYDPTFQTI